jgi:hypothetical protein
MAPEEVAVPAHGSDGRPTLFKVTAKADVWAFGVFLWEIGTGHTRAPWAKLDDPQVFIAVQRGRTLPTEELHPVVQALLARCWSREPAQRYQPLHAVRPFFALTLT